MKSASAKIAVYPGSFDPVTCAHVDVARRALRHCDQLIVAVGRNGHKTATFSVPERLSMLRGEFADLPNIAVESFDGWLALYARRRGASTLVRGIRNWRDVVSEVLMMGVNFCLGGGLRTRLVLARSPHTTTSSSKARRLAAEHGNLQGIVSEPVAAAMRERFGATRGAPSFEPSRRAHPAWLSRHVASSAALSRP